MYVRFAVVQSMIVAILPLTAGTALIIARWENGGFPWLAFVLIWAGPSVSLMLASAILARSAPTFNSRLGVATIFGLSTVTVSFIFFAVSPTLIITGLSSLLLLTAIGWQAGVGRRS